MTSILNKYPDDSAVKMHVETIFYHLSKLEHRVIELKEPISEQTGGVINALPQCPESSEAIRVDHSLDAFKRAEKISAGFALSCSLQARPSSSATILSVEKAPTTEVSHIIKSTSSTAPDKPAFLSNGSPDLSPLLKLPTVFSRSQKKRVYKQMNHGVLTSEKMIENLEKIAEEDKKKSEMKGHIKVLKAMQKEKDEEAKKQKLVENQKKKIVAAEKKKIAEEKRLEAANKKRKIGEEKASAGQISKKNRKQPIET